MRAKIRNNGRRTFGHRSSMTTNTKAIPSPRWRMELIITHLYGIMELLSRGESRAQGALLHASWPGIRGSITMEIGNGETRWREHRVSGKRWFNGMIMQGQRGPEPSSTVSRRCHTYEKIPLPDSSCAPLHASWLGIRVPATMEIGNGDYLFCARGWSMTFSSFTSHGSWITSNGE